MEDAPHVRQPSRAWFWTATPEQKLDQKIMAIEDYGRDLFRAMDGRAGRRLPPITNAADAWLRWACPRFYESAVAFQMSGILTTTEAGFDWKLDQVCLSYILGRLGFTDWKRLGDYFTVTDESLNGKYAEDQWRRKRDEGTWPRNFERVLAIIPEEELPPLPHLR